jgi:5-methyltetrahydrofolate--homocysteine methyltransferase
MKDIKTKLENNEKILLDGSLGALLMAKGIEPSQVAAANITSPELLFDIHTRYIAAGCDVVTSNTFGIGLNAEKATTYKKTDLVKAGVDILLDAIEKSGSQNVFSALDVGPFGDLLAPYGAATTEDAYAHYCEVISAAQERTDIILFETFTDINDIKAALRAAKETTKKPVFASMSFTVRKRTFMGASLKDWVQLAEEAALDACGINCTLTPQEMLPLAVELKNMTGIPVYALPNMGMPVQKDGYTQYEMKKEDFADGVAAIYKAGVKIVGGCCGSDDICMKMIYDRISGI